MEGGVRFLEGGGKGWNGMDGSSHLHVSSLPLCTVQFCTLDIIIS